MTEEQFDELMSQCAEAFITIYARLCEKMPKSLVITSMIGALAACATEAELERETAVEILNEAFNDIGEREVRS